jgi:hypothetical protein
MSQLVDMVGEVAEVESGVKVSILYIVSWEQKL